MSTAGMMSWTTAGLLVRPTGSPLKLDGSLLEPASHAAYDATDAQVTPPLLLRPRLPSRSAASQETGRRIEVIVSPTGEVEQVRLLSTTDERYYHDVMLLPAIKAWIFTPASRDGLPVRYRLELSLTH